MIAYHIIAPLFYVVFHATFNHVLWQPLNQLSFSLPQSRNSHWVSPASPSISALDPLMYTYYTWSNGTTLASFGRSYETYVRLCTYMLLVYAPACMLRSSGHNPPDSQQLGYGFHNIRLQGVIGHYDAAGQLILRTYTYVQYYSRQP